MTDYGLGATIISKDVKKAQIYSRIIDSGFVFINDMVTSSASLPAGGTKKSGFGRDCYTFGVQSFANVKTFSISK